MDKTLVVALDVALLDAEDVAVDVADVMMLPVTGVDIVVAVAVFAVGAAGVVTCRRPAVTATVDCFRVVAITDVVAVTA